MEAEILMQIRDSEKKAEKIIENAEKKKGVMVQDKIRESSKLMDETQEEIKKSKDKKISELRKNILSLREGKMVEGKKLAKQLKAMAEKNTSKAVEWVLKKFDEAV